MLIFGQIAVENDSGEIYKADIHMVCKIVLLSHKAKFNSTSKGFV
jgi:hypothetical protein